MSKDSKSLAEIVTRPSIAGRHFAEVKRLSSLFGSVIRNTTDITHLHTRERCRLLMVRMLGVWMKHCGINPVPEQGVLFAAAVCSSALDSMEGYGLSQDDYGSVMQAVERWLKDPNYINPIADVPLGGYSKEAGSELVTAFADALSVRMMGATSLVWFDQQWSAHGEPTYVLEDEFAEYLIKVPIGGLDYVEVALPYPAIELVIPNVIVRLLYDVGEPLGGPAVLGSVSEGSFLVQEAPEEGDTTQRWLITPLYGNAHSEYGKGGERFAIYPQKVLQGPVTVGASDRTELSVTQEAEISFRKLAEFVVASVLYITHPAADVILGRDCPEYQDWAATISQQRTVERKGRKHKRLTKRQRKQQERLSDLNSTNKRCYAVGFGVIDRHHAEIKAAEASGKPKRSITPHLRKAHQRRCWMINPKDPKGPKVRVWRPIKGSHVGAGIEYEISKIIMALR